MEKKFFLKNQYIYFGFWPYQLLPRSFLASHIKIWPQLNKLWRKFKTNDLNIVNACGKYNSEVSTSRNSLSPSKNQRKPFPLCLSSRIIQS